MAPAITVRNSIKTEFKDKDLEQFAGKMAERQRTEIKEPQSVT